MANFENIISIHPARVDPPNKAFNVLLIMLGLGSETESARLSAARNAWNRIAQTLFDTIPQQNYIAIYTSRQSSLDLGLETANGRLSIPEANKGALAAYLDASGLRDSSGEAWNASQVWPRFG